VVVCGDQKMVSFDPNIDVVSEVNLDDLVMGSASISWNSEARVLTYIYIYKVLLPELHMRRRT
jgi:hypothetical protein